MGSNIVRQFRGLMHELFLCVISETGKPCISNAKKKIEIIPERSAAKLRGAYPKTITFKIEFSGNFRPNLYSFFNCRLERDS